VVLLFFKTGAAKAGQEKIAREIADLEERASVAGTQSLALAAEIARLQDEVDTLRDEKLQLTQTLAEIGDVITAKDGEFREVLANLNAATEKCVFD
jgi:predicted  nucleic acid-binding Zn-ribbon protein